MEPYAFTVEIAAPATRVWSVLSDVSNWPSWLPTVTSVKPLDASSLTIGARYHLTQPGLRPAVWSVVELSPDSHFSWACRSPGVRVLASHSLHPVAADVTRVSLAIGFSGPLAIVARLAAGRMTLEYLGREAAALKLRVESS